MLLLSDLPNGLSFTLSLERLYVMSGCHCPNSRSSACDRFSVSKVRSTQSSKVLKVIFDFHVDQNLSSVSLYYIINCQVLTLTMTSSHSISGILKMHGQLPTLVWPIRIAYPVQQAGRESVSKSAQNRIEAI